MADWTREEIRRIGHLVVDLIAEHLTAIPNQPVFRPLPADLADQFLTTPAPAHAAGPDEILRDFRESVEPYPFGNGHPRFWGWVNSPPALMGVFADALAAAMNPSCAGGNHAAIYVERQVIAWLRELIGFPASAMGLLVSGGSMATLTGLAVARHIRCGLDVRTDGLRSAPQPFAFYLSSEAHTCARKAIELLGFGRSSIRTIATTADYRMDTNALDAAIARDIADGVRPIAVVATAGTTNTGSIDDLAVIRDICDRHRVWMHVDAAYGGPAILASEYADALKPIGTADSVALDPHKWMFVPVEAGFIIVRDQEAMRDAFSLVPPYIRSAGSATGVYGLPWFSEYGFQQTRGFRALKVWMTMKQFGVAGHKAAIEENIALARYLADRVRAAPDLELTAPPGLSVVCFRYVGSRRSGGGDVAAEPPDRDEVARDVMPPVRPDEAALAEVNRSLLERLQLGGEAFLTSTELRGRYTLRACVVNYRSTRNDIDRMLDAVRALGAAYQPM
jgi:aromatic-L-amino-acid/L-tryptophan decarboxylase